MFIIKKAQFFIIKQIKAYKVGWSFSCFKGIQLIATKEKRNRK